MEKLRLGMVRETKDPPDRRVPLNPEQCRRLLDHYPDLEITVQPSPLRCFADEEYSAQGITLDEDLSGCDVLMGVKEVRLDALLPDKTYFFFSHTAKEQPYNRGLLQEIIRKRIRMVDYEYLALDGVRVVAFGRWAGLVGAYNGLRGYGLKSGQYELKPAHDCFDLEELTGELKNVEPGQLRITVTGGGRVAGGALEVLDAAGFRQVSPADFLEKTFEQAVYPASIPGTTRGESGLAFDFGHFLERPGSYESSFDPYGERTDLFIPCHFWTPARRRWSAPASCDPASSRSPWSPISAATSANPSLRPSALPPRAAVLRLRPGHGFGNQPFEPGS